MYMHLSSLSPGLRMNTSAFLSETQDSAEELLSSANTGMGESAWITPTSFKTGIHKALCLDNHP